MIPANFLVYLEKCYTNASNLEIDVDTTDILIFWTDPKSKSKFLYTSIEVLISNPVQFENVAANGTTTCTIIALPLGTRSRRCCWKHQMISNDLLDLLILDLLHDLLY